MTGDAALVVNYANWYAAPPEAAQDTQTLIVATEDNRTKRRVRAASAGTGIG